jgi:hypothetical protein
MNYFYTDHSKNNIFHKLLVLTYKSNYFYILHLYFKQRKLKVEHYAASSCQLREISLNLSMQLTKNLRYDYLIYCTFKNQLSLLHNVSFYCSFLI